MDGSTANLLRRFLQRAPDALTDEELLTLLLHAGTGAEEPRTLAARLIGQFGSLGAALSASPEELASVEGMDASRALLLRLVTELHRRYYLSRPFSGARLTGTTDFGNFLLPFFYGAREELVYLLALDAAGRLLTCTCLSEGSVNSANVPMRKLMRAALSANASGVVLAHNHPAGIALPSHEDVELTRRLQQALDVVDILLLDHLVIAELQPQAVRGATDEALVLRAPQAYLERWLPAAGGLLQEPMFAGAAARAEQARTYSPGSLRPETARALYGAELHFSSSRIDVLAGCRFAHFLQYGLRAQEREPAEFDSRFYGTFVHDVLEYLLHHASELGRQVYDIPEEIDREVSRLKLHGAGLHIDALTPEQEAYLSGWQV